ncbi:MAG: DUF4230 domain-containing protein [Reichenbachiella sp.]
MIGYLLKNWKLLLDLILVVGGIILLTLFDPFGFFTSSKLKNTANMVSSIRSIGEFTTAEYYGEVVSSLHETKIYNVTPDTLFEEFEECYIDLRRTIASALVRQRRIRTRDWKKVNTDSISLRYNNPKEEKIYHSLLTFIAINNLSGQTKDYYHVGKNDAKINKGTEQKVLGFLVDKFSAFRRGLQKDINEISEDDLDQFILDMPSNFTGITSFHYDLKKKNIQDNRKRNKQDIVFIGRGWVKAGFRFEALDESNFYYNKDENVIQFFGLVPTIIDKDINPWFIPEEKIKGFELVNNYRGATFSEAAEVKKKCKEKLLAQAQKADILNSAKKNGEQALKEFFSLLLDEPNLKVELLDFPYGKEYEMIAADTLVTVEEALLVNELYQKIFEKDKNQTKRYVESEFNAFKLFLNRLKDLNFISNQNKFSLLSLQAAKILDDALFVTVKEYEEIKNIRSVLKSNQEGIPQTAYMHEIKLYENYFEFTRDFNDMLKAIDHVLEDYEFLREDTLYLSNKQFEDYRAVFDPKHFNVFEVIDKRDTIQKILHKEKTAPTFQNLRYPILNLESRLFDEISMFSIEDIESIVLEQKAASTIVSGDTTMQHMVSADLDFLAIYKIDSVKKSIQLKPIRSLSVNMNNLFK